MPGGTGISGAMEEASRRITSQNAVDPGSTESLAAKFGSGAGSAAGLVAAGGVGRALGAGAALASGVTGALQGAESGFRDYAVEADKLRQFGGEPLPTWKGALAYLTGGALGATEAIGIWGLPGRVSRGGGVGTFARRVGGEIVEESGQEFGQQVGENIAKEGLYGKDPGEWGIFTGAGEGALVGGVLGGGMGGIAHAGSLVPRAGAVPLPNTEAATPDEVAAQVAKGGIQVAPENVVPTGTPITEVQGDVKTTVVVHGPAVAYEAAQDVDGKPTLKAIPDGIGQAAEALGAATAGVDTTGTVETSAAVAPDATPIAQERSEPTQGLYSRLRDWIAEKGPLNATAARWIFSAEAWGLHVRRSFRILDCRRGSSPVARGAIRGACGRRMCWRSWMRIGRRSVEVTRVPLTQTEKALRIASIKNQITAVVRANPQLVNQYGEYNEASPLLAPLLADLEFVRDSDNWARFQQQTTPGPRESYTELTLHLPSRNVEKETLGFKWTQQQDFVGGHYVEPNELVTIRITVRRGLNGERIAVLEEVQSDMHQKGAALGYGSTEDLKVPDAPYKEGWQRLGFVRFLQWAAQNDIRHIAWTDAQEQMRRYSAGTEAQVREAAARNGGVLRHQVAEDCREVVEEARRHQRVCDDSRHPIRGAPACSAVGSEYYVGSLCSGRYAAGHVGGVSSGCRSVCD